MMQTQTKATGIRAMEANDKGKFKFGDGRWVCEDGGLPPKIQDPETYLWNDRGYIVFPKSACRGGAFDTQCYCWDKVRWENGKDPLTSEAMCDSTCGYGACESFSACGKSPPGPLPPPPPPPVKDPMAAELEGQKDLHINKGTMDPMPEGDPMGALLQKSSKGSASVMVGQKQTTGRFGNNRGSAGLMVGL